MVATKKNHPSYNLEADDSTIISLLLFAKKLGRQIDQNLGVQRTGLVAEGFGIDHLHVKLFPMHGVEPGKWKAKNSLDRTFYTSYTGMLATNDGPQMSHEELVQIAHQIQGEPSS